jgi:hypothetical protein
VRCGEMRRPCWPTTENIALRVGCWGRCVSTERAEWAVKTARFTASVAAQ